MTRRLSAEIGLRLTHFGRWYDYIGYGFPVFDYSKYNTSCKSTDYCGFLWNKRDPSVPTGGFPTRFLYYQPRMGVAYSLGKDTVLRGGWGRYYYHSAQFTTGLNVSSRLKRSVRGMSRSQRSPRFKVSFRLTFQSSWTNAA